MADVAPIPDGYPQVTPYLCVDGANSAIEFYSKVFGATERMRMPAPEGKVGHAELQIGDSVVMLADEFPEMGVHSPKSIGGTPVTLSVYVDADGRPAWAAIRTGRRETSLAPLAGASSTDGELRLAVEHRLVQMAPHGDDEGRLPEQLSEEQEAELSHYYSVDYTAGAAGAGLRRGTDADRLRGLLTDDDIDAR